MDATFIDLGVHHKPRGLSDRIALGFTKALRWCADTFFAERYGHRDVNHGFANELAGLPAGKVAECPPHAELQPNWKRAA